MKRQIALWIGLVLAVVLLLSGGLIAGNWPDELTYQEISYARSCPLPRDGVSAVGPEDPCWSGGYSPPPWWHKPGDTQPPIDPNEP
jgi:hypothetical protein